jgi:cytochrome P450
MVLNPDIQKKAQAEIDKFIPVGHLPSMEDKPSLPYVTAALLEVWRWRPVAPIGKTVILYLRYLIE